MIYTRTLEAYNFEYKHCYPKESPHLKSYKFVFTTESKIHYIVWVEEYINSFFAVKFHIKEHSSSKFKYHWQRKKDQRASLIEVRKILFTCVKIGVYIRDNICTDASFGFVGCPTMKEYNNKSFENTQRFKIYKRISLFFFNPEHYDHIQIPEKSGYLLINKSAKKKNGKIESQIIQMFENNYDIARIFDPLCDETAGYSMGQRKKHKKSRT